MGRVSRHRTAARQGTDAGAACAAGALLILRRLWLGLLLMLLLLMVYRTGDRGSRATHYRGCMLTRMNGTRGHRG